LQLERQIADLVEKQRTPIRELEAPLSLCERSREGASFVPEEFTLQECTWNCGAIQSNEWPLLSRALVVKGAGNDFFARAGFALNQGYRIAIGDDTNHVQDLLKREASSHNLDGAGGARFVIHRDPLSLLL
jgi:hypothetical protein